MVQVVEKGKRLRCAGACARAAAMEQAGRSAADLHRICTGVRSRTRGGKVFACECGCHEGTRLHSLGWGLTVGAERDEAKRPVFEGRCDCCGAPSTGAVLPGHVFGLKRRLLAEGTVEAMVELAFRGWRVPVGWEGAVELELDRGREHVRSVVRANVMGRFD